MTMSRRQALRFAAAAPLVLAAPVSMAPTASAASTQLIDFTERLVWPEQIRAAGYAGALVYVSELRPGADFDFKPVTREYADAMRVSKVRGGSSEMRAMSSSVVDRAAGR